MPSAETNRAALLASIHPRGLFVIRSCPLPFVLLVTLAFLDTGPACVKVEPVSFTFYLN